MRCLTLIVLLSLLPACAGLQENWFPKNLSTDEQKEKDEKEHARQEEFELSNVIVVALGAPLPPTSKSFTGRPKTDYDEIAALMIEGKAPSHRLLGGSPDSYDELVGVLKRKAAELGANAIVALTFNDVETDSTSFLTVSSGKNSSNDESVKKYKRVVKAVAVFIRP